MPEEVYNLFPIYEQDICSKIGFAVHNVELNDADAIAFLRECVESDWQSAQIHHLAKPFTNSEYLARCRLGTVCPLFEDFFIFRKAGATPLFVSTPVCDGKPTFNYSSQEAEPLDLKDVAAKLGEKGEMVDWLQKYTNDDGIDIPQLIHDDYFLAIKLTYNAGLHVSAMKLLLSCIDSVAYIEFGNEKPTPFIDWLNLYADLRPLEINAAELWELRNGILHMTNISARKVLANKVRRISFRTGGPPDYPKKGDDGVYYFDFYELILAFAAAVKRWIESYNADREKFVKFVERYDETISDSRISYTKLSSTES